MAVLTFGKAAAILGAVLVAVTATPAVAKAQNRGTMQVSARVVDSRPAFDALQAARSATTHWAASRSTGLHNVSTLAQVSVAPREAANVQGRGEVAALVVTIDYAKN